jgi:hypothetical protein
MTFTNIRPIPFEHQETLLLGYIGICEAFPRKAKVVEFPRPRERKVFVGPEWDWCGCGHARCAHDDIGCEIEGCHCRGFEE